MVFDSSAQYDGVSLNNVLLTGPDLNNTLLGVLIRFRREAIAFIASNINSTAVKTYLPDKDCT